MLCQNIQSSIMGTDKWEDPPILLWILFMLLAVPTLAAQCIYDPKTFSVTADQPVNPITNCLEYCRLFYSQAPQRGYYNMSNQNCEPLRLCNLTESHYNYATNLCYVDGQFKVEADSYIPATLQAEAIVFASKTVEMICLNGDFILLKIGSPGVCSCKLLWESSRKVDMNGFPFYCDKVTEQPDRHFYKSLKFDGNGKLIQYGPFTVQQMETILANMKSFERSQSSQYALNQTQPILYSVNTDVPSQSLVRNQDFGYLAVCGAAVFIIFGASYWQHQKLRIIVRRSMLQKKLENVINS